MYLSFVQIRNWLALLLSYESYNVPFYAAVRQLFIPHLRITVAVFLLNVFFTTVIFIWNHFLFLNIIVLFLGRWTLNRGN